MKFREHPYFHIGVTAFSVIAAGILFYYGVFHMKTLISGIGKIFAILAPIIYGLAIAYVLNPVVNFLEHSVIFPVLDKRKVSVDKRGKRFIRWICVLFSLFLLLLAVYALIMMIFPQIYQSIMSIIDSFPGYLSATEEWLSSISEFGLDLGVQPFSNLQKSFQQLQEDLTSLVMPSLETFTTLLKNMSNGVFDILNMLKNFLVGVIVSIYVMVDKETFIARSKMVLYALFSQSRANNIIHSMRFTHRTFGGFINGKILDSAIMGVLCYIGVTILNMPYTLLVSVVVGATNIIPFFGPFFGAVPCSILILLVNPVKGLYFILFILILQQFDGNILGPKILGNSTGLSSFMVIVAIMIGGGLFGVVGMIVGVPICAVIYAAIWNLMGGCLRDKQMSDETTDYLNIDCIDEETGKTIMMPERKPVQKPSSGQTRDNLFMKVWRTAMAFLKKVWNVVYKYGRIILKELWKYLKILYKNIKRFIVFVFGSGEKEKQSKNRKDGGETKNHTEQTENIRPENRKLEDINSGNRKLEGINSGNRKLEDIKSGNRKLDDIKSENRKLENNKLENKKLKNNKSENNSQKITTRKQ